VAAIFNAAELSIPLCPGRLKVRIDAGSIEIDVHLTQA
jgi:hypothetical protein